MRIVERVKTKERQLRSNIRPDIRDQLVLSEYALGIVLINVVGASEWPYVRCSRQRSVCVAQEKLVLSVGIYVSDSHGSASSKLSLHADGRLHGVRRSQIGADLITSWRWRLHGSASGRESRNNCLQLGKPI